MRLTILLFTAGIAFAQVPPEPAWQAIEGGLKDTLATTFTPTGPEPPVTENASLSATLLISNEEPLEIKAVTYPN